MAERIEPGSEREAEILARAVRSPGEGSARDLEGLPPEALAGARVLGAALGAWRAEEPPAGLRERAIARLRLADALAAGQGRESGRLATSAIPPVGTAATGPAASAGLRVLEGGSDRSRRRRSVELLASWALPGPRPEVAPRERLGLRLLLQAAAAVVLFAACTGFTIRYYPVVVEALEDSRQDACQKRIAKLADAVVRFQKAHPELALLPEAPRGLTLKNALVREGFVAETDFVCPAVRGVHEGACCYHLRLPDPRHHGRSPIVWDHFGNHGGAINLARESGSVERIEGELLGARLGEPR